MKNTVRVLVGWRCNLRCSYCCNLQERLRAQFQVVALDEIAWGRYPVVCISGGEPLLYPDRVRTVCERAAGRLIVLYTNGLLLAPGIATDLARWGVHAVNVGLHYGPMLSGWQIKTALGCFQGTGVRLRFHAEEAFRGVIDALHPGVEFRFWRMDDCDRANEDRVIVREWSAE